MSDEGTHAELLMLLATAHEAVGNVHRYVHERRPKLNGSGIYDTPVAWRKHKFGAWTYADHHPLKADLAQRHGWEPLFVAPDPDDDGPAAVGAAG